MKKNYRKVKKSNRPSQDSLSSDSNKSTDLSGQDPSPPHSPKAGSFYAEAKYAEYKLKDMEKAEELYKLAIEKNDRTESAIKDLASLLHQKRRTVEAVSLLKDNSYHFVENIKKFENLLSSLENQLKCNNSLCKSIKISNLEENMGREEIMKLFVIKCRIEHVRFDSEIEDGRLNFYCVVYFPSHSSARKALSGFAYWNKYCVEWVSENLEVICDAHYARQKIVNHRKATPTFEYVLFERESREFLYSLALDSKYLSPQSQSIEKPEELLGLSLFQEIFVL